MPPQAVILTPTPPHPPYVFDTCLPNPHPRLTLPILVEFIRRHRSSMTLFVILQWCACHVQITTLTIEFHVDFDFDNWGTPCLTLICCMCKLMIIIIHYQVERCAPSSELDREQVVDIDGEITASMNAYHTRNRHLYPRRCLHYARMIPTFICMCILIPWTLYFIKINIIDLHTLLELQHRSIVVYGMRKLFLFAHPITFLFFSSQTAQVLLRFVKIRDAKQHL